MRSVNKVILVGHLAADPEQFQTKSGKTRVSFPIATHRDSTSDGVKKEVTDYLRVVCWGKLGEVCASYLAKGQGVYVEGAILNRAYEKDGERTSFRPSRERQPFFEPLTLTGMIDTLHPTDLQAALYRRLLRQYGNTSQWEILTKARCFESMTPHRAAHFLARLLAGLTGHSASVPCGCTGSVYAAQSQKHPDARRGAPVVRSV